MKPIEKMTKAIRSEFVDHIVDNDNPHWAAQKPDYLKEVCKKAGYPDPDNAADFFAKAASRAALLALAEAELPREAEGRELSIMDHAVFRAMLRTIFRDCDQ
jgi:hypothetical protein